MRGVIGSLVGVIEFCVVVIKSRVDSLGPHRINVSAGRLRFS